MAQGYGAAALLAAKDRTAYSDFLEGLLREETAGRTVRKQSRMTRLAGFPAIKTLERFNYDFAKGVKRSQVEELAGLGFIKRNENVVLVGPAALARPTWRLRWATRPRRPVSRRASWRPPTCC